MPSSYTKCFFDGVVPTGNAGNFRPDDYDYSKNAERLIKMLELKSSDSVLDIGCGNGLLADHLIHRVGRMTLIEANENLIKFLINKYPDTKTRIICTTSFDLSEIPDESYDKIICIAVLQYCDIDEAKKTVEETYRVCKKGGLIYFGDIFDANIIKDTRDGMGSFNAVDIANGYNYEVVESNYEPEKRYDLIIKK